MDVGQADAVGGQGAADERRGVLQSSESSSSLSKSTAPRISRRKDARRFIAGHGPEFRGCLLGGQHVNVAILKRISRPSLKSRPPGSDVIPGAVVRRAAAVVGLTQRASPQLRSIVP